MRVAHLMLVMVQNLPEQCSFQDLFFFHLLFIPKSAEKSASRMNISLGVNISHPVLTVPPCRPSCTSDRREIWWSDGCKGNTRRHEMGIAGSVDACCVPCLVCCAVTDQQYLTAAVCVTAPASCFKTVVCLVV